LINPRFSRVSSITFNSFAVDAFKLIFITV
jgi:hypothetical protein